MTFDLASAIANHHEYFHAKQTVTLRDDLAGTSDSVAHVTTSRLSFKAMQMVGSILGVEDEARTFSLPASLCAFAPEVGMRIVDESSNSWRILSVDLAVMGACYSCTCVQMKTDEAKPLQAIGLTLSGATATQITATWTHRRPGVTETWQLQRSTSSSFTSPTTTTSTSSSLNTTTNVTSLLPGTTYYFRVRHVNDEGNGPWSETESLATSAALASGQWTVGDDEITAATIDLSFDNLTAVFPNDGSDVPINSVDGDGPTDHSAFFTSRAGDPTRVLIVGPAGTTQDFTVSQIEDAGGGVYRLDSVSGASGSYSPSNGHTVTVYFLEP